MERESVFIPKSYANDDPNLLVSINGVNYLLPRGKSSLVPRAVAEEICRSRRAQEVMDKRMERLLEKAE